MRALASSTIWRTVLRGVNTGPIILLAVPHTTPWPGTRRGAKIVAVRRHIPLAITLFCAIILVWSLIHAEVGLGVILGAAVFAIIALAMVEAQTFAWLEVGRIRTDLQTSLRRVRGS